MLFIYSLISHFVHIIIIYMHTYIHTRMYVHMYLYVHLCIYTNIYYIYIYIILIYFCEHFLYVAYDNQLAKVYDHLSTWLKNYFHAWITEFLYHIEEDTRVVIWTEIALPRMRKKTLTSDKRQGVCISRVRRKTKFTVKRYDISRRQL